MCIIVTPHYSIICVRIAFPTLFVYLLQGKKFFFKVLFQRNFFECEQQNINLVVIIFLYTFFMTTVHITQEIHKLNDAPIKKDLYEWMP